MQLIGELAAGIGVTHDFQLIPMSSFLQKKIEVSTRINQVASVVCWSGSKELGRERKITATPGM